MIKVYFAVYVAIILASMSTHGQSEDLRLQLVHNIRFDVTPEPEPFVPVTVAQGEVWDRIVKECMPINTRKELAASCLSLLEEYFSNEAVWALGEMRYYHYYDGWVGIYMRDNSQRTHYSHADFIDTDFPLWGDIFDDQIDERQQRFLQVLEDPDCKELADSNVSGIHEARKEKCAAREIFKYATYLDACSDSQQILNFLQQSNWYGPSFDDLNVYEISLKGLEEWVPDIKLRFSAEQRLVKGYLHSYWVNQQCKLHGYAAAPGVSTASSLLNEDLNPWLDNLETRFNLLSLTDLQAMKIAAKSGDAWAIRSFDLGSHTSEFNQDVLKKYPLLMHRLLGSRTAFYDFTSQEKARHRAKAYLLLVEQAGEEVAQQEYDPAKLTEEIQYVTAGGALRLPPTRAEVLEQLRGKARKRAEDELLEEAKGELH